MAPDFRLLAAAFLFVTLSSCDGNALHPEPDRAAPQVTLTAPAEGILLRDDSVRVTGTARDSAGAVTRVLYALGSGAEREVPVTPGREVSFAFTVTGLAPGSNTITVYAIDERGNRGSQTVTVTYQPNRPPIARDDTASTWTDSTVVIRVLANDTDADGDSLQIEGVTSPAFGTVAVDSGATLTYTPGPARAGAVTFQYVVSDDRGATDTAQVTVRVRPDPRLGAYRVTEVILPPVSAAGTVEGSTTRVLRLNNQGELLLSRRSTVRVESAPGAVRTVEEYLVWHDGRTRNALPAEPAADSQRVYDINNLGQTLARICTRASGSPEVCEGYSLVIISRSGSRQPLPYSGWNPAGGDLNDAGQALLGYHLCQADGCAPVSAGEWYPVLLNARGEIAGGHIGLISRISRAALYRNRQVTVVGMNFSVATGFNDSTWMVGSSPLGIFVWKEGTTTYISNSRSEWFAQVNNRGQVVFGASLWEGGRTFPLNAHVTDPAWEVVSIDDINDAGQIAVHGRKRSTGAPALLVLTPER